MQFIAAALYDATVDNEVLSDLLAATLTAGDQLADAA